MIFVILGICVLVASFLIALVSLIREQSKLVKEAKQDQAESIHTRGPEVKKKVVLGGQVESGTGVVLNKQDVAVADADADAKPAINRPLFPWEEGKYKAAGDISDADREKVEMLRAQLAELKSRVATKSSVRDEVKVHVVKPTVELEQEQQQDHGQIQNFDQNKDQGQQKLDGVIYISNTKRQ